MAKLRKLGRPTDQRKALLRALTTDFLKHGKIETTFHRAKETQRMAEKMITLGKKGDLSSRRRGRSSPPCAYTPPQHPQPCPVPCQ